MLEKLTQLSQSKLSKALENRILSELKFAYLLSEEYNNKFHTLLSDTEQFILNEWQNTGCLTQQTVDKAENMLLPMKELAKSYQVICTAHAHIDMNWQWSFDETVSVTIDTFKTILQIMREYPDFKFSQSQASVYKIVEEYCPDMLNEIKQRVNQGRWEITASHWVEADKNMPNGESLSRHILYTKKYLSKLFDINPDCLNIDFEPDTFGHSANIPEVLEKGGVKFYYHCRGKQDGPPIYKWKSQSGASVIVHRDFQFYNSDIDTTIAYTVPTLARLTGSKKVLKVYGVGDHGGGPTRRDIERLISYNNYPIFPEFKFGTFSEYFAEIEKIEDTLPIVDQELNFIFDGCYTTQTRTKAGNRNSEKLLIQSEAICAIASRCGYMNYPNQSFENAWRKTLFNQFHDILPGSGIIDTREYASGQHQEVSAAAITNRKLAFQSISDNINTNMLILKEDVSETISEGAGAGHYMYSQGAGKTRIFHVFNTAAYDRTELCELILWDYPEKPLNIVITDCENNIIPYQIVENGHYWAHNFVKILIEASVPSMGYNTYILKPQDKQKIPLDFVTEMRTQSEESFVLENDYIKAEFNPYNGAIISIIDKATNTQLIDSSRGGVIFRLIDEACAKEITWWKSYMSSWIVGRYKNIESIHKDVEFHVASQSPLRNHIEYKTNFRNSNITVKVSLDKNSNKLDFHVNCCWKEFGNADDKIPSLCFYAPLSYHCKKYKYDIPMGTINRKEHNMDIPGNSFVCGISDKKKSLLLTTQTKYGFRGFDSSLALTLIRSSVEPDPMPEIGNHIIQFSLSVVDTDIPESSYINNSYNINNNLYTITGSLHTGNLCSKDSFLRLLNDDVIISSIKQSEDGLCDIIRFYEPCSKETEVKLQLKHMPKSAVLTDITENKLLSEDVRVNNNIISFNIKPNCIANLKLIY